MTEVQLWEALSMLAAAVQMLCIAVVATAFPIWAIQMMSE